VRDEREGIRIVKAYEESRGARVVDFSTPDRARRLNSMTGQDSTFSPIGPRSPVGDRGKGARAGQRNQAERK
jgi:hypothetical protein